MFRFRRSLTLILLSMLLSVTCDDQIQPKITLKDGTGILGLYKEYNNDILPAHSKIDVFYGIPYAEAPVGQLRFKPSIPKGRLESPYNASVVGRSCMQMDPDIVGIPLTNEELSEDCLFLDVTAPNPKPDGAPVVVWIHGGGFSIGAGQMPFSNGFAPVAYGNIIIVTLNYRLGPFGFLTTGDDLIPANLGLLDQQLALTWVNKNIEAFGGDPNKVTISGVSAGSGSVACHTLSPGSAGLFTNAIMQSGAPVFLYRSREDVKRQVKTLARLVNCSANDIQDDTKLLDCLQAATADDILDQTMKFAEEFEEPIMMYPAPYAGGSFMPKDPFTMADEGKFNAENMIIGTNAEEGTMFLFGIFPDKDVKPIVNETMFVQLINQYFNNLNDPVLVELIKTIYAPDPKVLLDGSPDYFEEATQYLGDKWFECFVSRFARSASESQNVYRYLMTFTPSNNFMGVKWAGACHGDEGQYFNGAVFDEMYINVTTDEEKDMSRKAMQYWINFIRSGNPNDPEGNADSTLPAWPTFTKEDDIFKNLTPDMDNIHDNKQRKCYFLQHVLPSLQDMLKELITLKEEKDQKSKWTEEDQCEGDSCHRTEGP